MIEKIQQGPRDNLKRGDIVKLKEDIDRETFEIITSRTLQPDVEYRVLHYEHHDEDEGGGVVWLGSVDMSLEDVQDFRPELAGASQEERYRDVLPLAAAYVRKALH